MKSGVIAESKGNTQGTREQLFSSFGIFLLGVRVILSMTIHDNEYQGKAKRGQSMSCERSKSMLNEKVVN